MKVYGIPNCDTVKKALDWFKANEVAYEFHDFKKLGISADKLEEWAAKAGYEKILNLQSSTFKALDQAVKDSTTTKAGAFDLVQQKTSIIKRPVIEDGDFLFFGFNADAYASHFLKG